MKRELFKTADGSMTIHLPDINEQYHSKHGALQEAQHVFIKMGLQHLVTQSKDKNIAILEIGFGTGLNCLLTYFEALKLKLNIDYVGVEAYPISSNEWKAMNYGSLLEKEEATQVFENIHVAEWDKRERIVESFSLKKEEKKFENINENSVFNLIYFDAFGARVQPELWTETIFEIMYNALKPKGVLVTYAAKGSVRRAMQAVGFTVERLEGPPGKREMLRATKSVG
ncbi:tRNA (5-methylaminomethyl-2-thiouridine)(34)-methyltransferase MnmD [Aquimarina agarilytica]|uniref:tRNA (5-methylaminomethyl-2-thiouridine)(34)-methyltransferase MnmD n=1 Tax=Aquimarina agarilytica TaxID=1087449 RepID=UPI000288AD2E|nr:tRNA (5-methylaminomethyl-2-thiouridine)(34)-methyltransferase MnmD [Aquimarina agarilytica]